MKVGLQISSFTWPGGPEAIGPTLARVVRQADDVGFDSIWVMDHFFQIRGVGSVEETMLEGPTTNIWWRRDRTLQTPSLDLGILAGVTRATVLELAGDSGYTVAEGHYGLTELLAADEAFTSSSVREVMPVTEVDGVPLARGPAADELQAALRRAAGDTLPA